MKFALGMEALLEPMCPYYNNFSPEVRPAKYGWTVRSKAQYGLVVLYAVALLCAIVLIGCRSRRQFRPIPLTEASSVLIETNAAAVFKASLQPTNAWKASLAGRTFWAITATRSEPLSEQQADCLVPASEVHKVFDGLFMDPFAELRGLAGDQQWIVIRGNTNMYQLRLVGAENDSEVFISIEK